MDKVSVIRTVTSAISVFGIIFFIRTVVKAINGSLVTEVNPVWEVNMLNSLWSFLLYVPISLHIIFIGLVLQKRWLPKKWRKITWIGIMSSGIWLGIALGFKEFMI